MSMTESTDTRPPLQQATSAGATNSSSEANDHQQGSQRSSTRSFFALLLRSCAAPVISVAGLALIAYLYSGLMIVTGTSLSSHIEASHALTGAVGLLLSGLGVTFTLSGVKCGIPALLFMFIDIASWIWMDALFTHKRASSQRLSQSSRVVCEAIVLCLWVMCWYAVTLCTPTGLVWNHTDVILHSLLIGLVAIAFRYRSSLASQISTWASHLGGQHLVHALSTAGQITKRVGEAIIILSCIGVVWLFCAHFSSIVNIVTALGLSDGTERIAAFLLVLLLIAWLPNLQIAVLGWMSGGVFVIGHAGSISLTSVTHQSLPLLPAFGMIPDPVASPPLRTLLMILPGLCAGIAAMTALVKNFLSHEKTSQPLRFIIAESLVSVLFTCIIVIFLLWIWMDISAGSLGSQQLAFVGLPFSRSFAPLLRPLLYGCGAAEVITIISAIVIKQVAHHE
jgi:hypothetical protein